MSGLISTFFCDNTSRIISKVKGQLAEITAKKDVTQSLANKGKGNLSNPSRA